MNEEIKDKLRNCNNLNQMWLVLNEHYNMSQKLGTLGKSAVINNIHLLIKATGTKKK